MKVKETPDAWRQLVELTEPEWPDTERAVLHPLDEERLELIYPDDSRAVIVWNDQTRRWESA